MTVEKRSNWSDVARDVELLDVRTTGTLARLGRGPVPEYGSVMDASFKVQVGFSRDGEGLFSCLLSVDVKPRRRAGEREFARFIYRGVAKYRTKSDNTDEALLQFSQTNAMIHLWPYARHWVQTASAQLNLVPIVLPAYRINAPKQKQNTTE